VTKFRTVSGASSDRQLDLDRALRRIDVGQRRIRRHHRLLPFRIGDIASGGCRAHGRGGLRRRGALLFQERSGAHANGPIGIA
jgi:hypothetical protein